MPPPIWPRHWPRPTPGSARSVTYATPASVARSAPGWPRRRATSCSTPTPTCPATSSSRCRTRCGSCASTAPTSSARTATTARPPADVSHLLRRQRRRAASPPGGRLLVVNADDYGLTEGVSEASLRAARDGIVTSTSVLVLGRGFATSGKWLADDDRLGVGVHLA